MFYIQDWAGNVLLNGQAFNTFEDAWDYIYSELTDKLDLDEDDYQDYYVVQGKLRESRYLDANDRRKGLKIDSEGV